MKTIAALLAIGLCALPALYAGIPGLAPDAFDDTIAGIPASVVVMSALLAVFILLGWLSSFAARRDGPVDTGAE